MADLTSSRYFKDSAANRAFHSKVHSYDIFQAIHAFQLCTAKGEEEAPTT